MIYGKIDEIELFRMEEEGGEGEEKKEEGDEGTEGEGEGEKEEGGNKEE